MSNIQHRTLNIEVDYIIGGIKGILHCAFASFRMTGGLKTTLADRRLVDGHCLSGSYFSTAVISTRVNEPKKASELSEDIFGV